MSIQPKMRLSDLQMPPADPIDWAKLDSFFYQDAKTQLAHSLYLINIIKENNLIQHVNTNVVMSYVAKLSSDTTMMSNELNQMTQSYEANKARYKNNYDENAHMYSLQVSFLMIEWLEKFENAVGVCFNDLIDYIVNNLPSDSELSLTLNNLGKLNVK